MARARCPSAQTVDVVRGAGMLGFSRDATTIAGAATDGSNHVSLWRVG